jgi:CHRD domain
MSRLTLFGTAAAAALLAIGLGASGAGNSGGTDSKQKLQADTMTGYQETPGVSSIAFGEFTAEIDDATQTITYVLTYAGLEAPVLFAHIHFGNRSIAGGVSAFLCGGGTKPPCPQAGTVTGVITAADVVGPANQGIEPGSMAELIRAMRAGETYANVHSTKFPAGEIRAQIADKDQRQPQ